jgi:hypothetical protein
LLSASFNQSGTQWDQGNFNGGAKTNFADFQLLSANFGQSLQLDNAQFTAMDDFSESAGLGYLVPNADDVGFSFSSTYVPYTAAVPEPASLTIIGGTMAALGFIRPRRRKNKADNKGGAQA